MALLFELVTSAVRLALKPLLLAKISCQIGLRSVSIIVETWLELLRFALYLHLVILWRVVMLAIAVLSLPVRAFAALSRERLLEIQLHRVRYELENALWDRKELEMQLHVAVKERRMMETMLTELEEEHDEAIVRIELLDGEVQDLKDEIQQLKEVQGRTLWSYDGRGDVCNDSNITSTDNIGTISWRPDCNDETQDVIKAGSKVYGLSQLYVRYTISTGSETLAEQRVVAISRSLFSAALSLVVGIVVWEAQDPCTPLVVALFSVVTLSLMSVVQLLPLVERPASEAVALLSFNWFLLGMLASPMLPRIGRILARLGWSFLGQTFDWLGLCFYV
ncbi:hypothetical protein Salat_1825900 [Sesamum alatum]|uniref:Uncharacterized protein n=1 Tax=Sesamum alatum TaxID=300844 RepID=A0AAE2CHI0_9LAMI|nr:hypothetical protein Salat_1825900 [Sesamum alatum]